MILHNYVHVFQACDRVSLIQDGVISFDKPTAETSVDELTDIVVEEYRRARQAQHLSGGDAAPTQSAPPSGSDTPAAGASPDSSGAAGSGGT
jgi:ABC-type sugar transport system ATPase subunit